MGHFHGQLPRISHRSSPKLARVSENLLIVRVLSWALGRVAPLRTRSQAPATQGFFRAPPGQLLSSGIAMTSGRTTASRLWRNSISPKVHASIG